MYYVYLLRSLRNAKETYIGRTDNLRTRVKGHNQGKSPHTNKHRPWEIVTYIAFKNKKKAIEFEKYLKVGSGHAFAKRRFW